MITKENYKALIVSGISIPNTIIDRLENGESIPFNGLLG